jgi:hypothetical protein
VVLDARAALRVVVVVVVVVELREKGKGRSDGEIVAPVVVVAPGVVGWLAFRPFCLIVNTSSTMYCRVLPRASGHRERVFAGVVRAWERVTARHRGGHQGPSTFT